MTSTDFIIREIEPRDNAQLATVVREVIVEMGAPTTGTAYEDKATDNMFEAYQEPRTKYFVLIHQDKVVGGGGIAPLQDSDGTICELRKNVCSKCHIFWSTSNTSLGKFGSKIIEGRLLIEDLQYP